MDIETPAGKLDPETEDPRFMMSLARGLLVLDAFAQTQTHTLASASRLTGLPRATVRRCLYTLQKMGYVIEDAGSFTVTRKVLGLAALFRQETHVFAQVEAALGALTKATGELCVFGTIDGEEALILARAEPTARIVSFKLGRRIPVHCSAMGRACLSGVPTERLEGLLRRAPFPKLTDKTKSSAEDLRAAIETARQCGYAVVDDELELGVKAVAVAVRDSAQQAIGAVSVVTVRPHSRTEFKVLLGHMRECAREIGAQLAAANMGDAEVLNLGGANPS